MQAFLDARKNGLLESSRTSPSVVLISPPCQGFSGANNGGQNDVENNQMMTYVSQIAEIFEPHWLVLENVPGYVIR